MADKTIVTEFDLPGKAPSGILGSGVGPTIGAGERSSIKVRVLSDGDIEFWAIVPGQEPERVVPTPAELAYVKEIVASREKAQKGEGGEKPTYRTFPDGSLRHQDPRTGEWIIDATKPQGPTVPEAPELVTLPDGSKAQWNPAKGDWDVKFTKPAAVPKGPEITVPARRPGQTTDLTSVKNEADAYVRNLDAQLAAGTIKADEYGRLWDSYYQTNVKPKIEQANQEANAEAARLAQRQTEADRRAGAREDRATSLGEAEFGQQAGRNAVADALALLPYQVSPTFLREFAAGLGTLSSGGGHVQFSPEAFQIQLPDLNALADQGAQRAAAMYRGTAGVPFTPQGAPPVAAALPPGAPPAAAPAAPPAVAQALAGVPMLPPPRTSMPGAATAIQAGSVGGEPSQEELARRLAAGYGP